MPKIIVASHNPVKLEATLKGFEKMFPDDDWITEGISVDSGVPDQPTSDQQTLDGATNRAIAARSAVPDATYWIGIEGGIQDTDTMTAFAWVVVLSADLQGKARTGTLELPPEVARLVRSGKELGEADDIVFGQENSKQANGAVGLLTGDVIDRTRFYVDAVVLALIPFRNKDLYAT